MKSKISLPISLRAALAVVCTLLLGVNLARASTAAAVTLSPLSTTYTGSPIALTAYADPTVAGFTYSYTGTGATTYGPSAAAPTNAGTYSVTATVNDPSYTGSAVASLTINQATQTVNFYPIIGFTQGISYTLVATASSGLPVTFSVQSGSATITGTTLRTAVLTSTTIAASQAGNANYSAATTITQTLTAWRASTRPTQPNGSLILSPANQTITAGSSITFTASGGAGTGPYVWSLPAGATGGAASGAYFWSLAGGSSGEVTGATNTVTFNTPGLYSISVYQESDSSYVTSNTASTGITVSPATVTLTVVSAPSSGGSVTGGGSAAQGSVLPITATPAAGYYFCGWSPANLVANSSNANTSVTLNSTEAVTAHFTACPFPTLANTGVTISPLNQTITVGASIVFTASGGLGTGAYVWTLPVGSTGGATGATNTVTFNSPGVFQVSVYQASDSLYLQSNTAMTGVTVNIATYTLTVLASPVDGGTVTGSGTAPAGTVLPITASPAAGFSFTGWTPTNAVANSSAADTSVTLSSNVSVTANFAASTVVSTGTINFPNADTGVSPTTSTANALITNSDAVPLLVSSMTTTGDFYSTNSLPFSVPANSSVSVPITFGPTAIGTRTGVLDIQGTASTPIEIIYSLIGTGIDPTQNYTLTVTASGSGTTSGSGTYSAGTVVPIVATPATGWTFSGWSGSGGSIAGSSSSTTTDSIGTTNASAIATFTANSYTVTVSPSLPGAGSATGGGTYHYGDSVLFTATANTGYGFAGFTGDAVSGSDPYSTTVTGNMNVIANFIPTSFTLTTSKTGSGSVAPTTGNYSPGTVVAITATPSAGSYFNGWTGDVPAAVSSQHPEPATFNLTILANTSLTAAFATTAAQTITFPAVNGGTPVTNGSMYPLGATASSGLPVSYTVISGPGTVTGSTLTVTGSTAIVVQASQAGNTFYLAAAPVQVTVSPTVQPRTFMNLNTVRNVVTVGGGVSSNSQNKASVPPTAVGNSAGSPFLGTPSPAQTAALVNQAAAAASTKTLAPGILSSGATGVSGRTGSTLPVSGPAGTTGPTD